MAPQFLDDLGGRSFACRVGPVAETLELVEQSGDVTVIGLQYAIASALRGVDEVERVGMPVTAPPGRPHQPRRRHVRSSRDSVRRVAVAATDRVGQRVAGAVDGVDDPIAGGRRHLRRVVVDGLSDPGLLHSPAGSFGGLAGAASLLLGGVRQPERADDETTGCACDERKDAYAVGSLIADPGWG